MVATHSFLSRPNVEEDMQKFQNFYPEIKKLLLDDLVTQLVANTFGEFIDHILPGGRLIRPILTMECFRAMASEDTKKEITERELYSVAWLLEARHALIVAVDDKMDNSRFRRGYEAWHVKHKFSIANSSLLLYGVINTAIRKACSHGPHYYTKVVQALNTSTRHALESNLLDDEGKRMSKNRDFTDFYRTMTLLKASYTYETSINVGLYMANYDVASCSDILKKIYDEWTLYLGLMNDFLDAYGDITDSGKVVQNEDIRSGQITYFLVEALKNGNEQQKQIIAEHYGLNNEKSVKKVMDVYNEMEMRSRCLKEEERLQKVINENINSIPDSKLKAFMSEMQKINSAYKQPDFLGLRKE